MVKIDLTSDAKLFRDIMNAKEGERLRANWHAHSLRACGAMTAATVASSTIIHY